MLPCHLETDLASSVRLYESAGYHVLTDVCLATVGGLRMWTMRRERSYGKCRILNRRRSPSHGDHVRARLHPGHMYVILLRESVTGSARAS